MLVRQVPAPGTPGNGKKDGINPGVAVAVFFGVVIAKICLLTGCLALRRFVRNGYRFQFREAREERAARERVLAAIRNEGWENRPPVNRTSEDVQLYPIVVYPPQSPRPILIYSPTPRTLLTTLDVSRSDEYADQVCPICLEPLVRASDENEDGTQGTEGTEGTEGKERRKVAALPCGHPLHEHCLREWMAKKRKPICPICLTDFSEEALLNSANLANAAATPAVTHAATLTVSATPTTTATATGSRSSASSTRRQNDSNNSNSDDASTSQPTTNTTTTTTTTTTTAAKTAAPSRGDTHTAGDTPVGVAVVDPSSDREAAQRVEAVSDSDDKAASDGHAQSIETGPPPLRNDAHNGDDGGDDSGHVSVDVVESGRHEDGRDSRK